MIMGVDLSLTSTGIAIAGADAVRVRRIQTQGRRTDTWSQRHQRMQAISSQVEALAASGAIVAIESPSYGSMSGSSTDRAGLWWAVYDVLHRKGCVIVPIAPTVRAKYATGKGNAGKDQVLAAAVRRYPSIDISGNDTADAVVLMAIGCRLLGEPIDDPMPVAHLAALDKLPTLAPVTVRP